MSITDFIPLINIYFFLIRVMKLEYGGEETVKGILGYKFLGSNGTFNYSIMENNCFCIATNKLGKGQQCLKNGIMDLKTCTGGLKLC